MLCKWKQTEGEVAIYFKTKILSREKGGHHAEKGD